MQAVEAEFMPQSLATIPQQQMGLEQTISQQQEAMVRAAVEARYALAIRQPRDLDAVRLRLLKDCKRPRFAEVARYAKPQGKKQDPKTGQWVDNVIEGPSIRFVEAALRSLTNVYPETSVIYDDPRKRLMRVSVTDLEANVTYSHEVSVTKTVERSNAEGREIISVRQNKKGKPVYTVEATDDEVLVRQNSLVSKTLRVLGLRILPGDLVDEAMDVVQQTQTSQDKADPETQRRRVFDAFAQMGIQPDEIKEYVGREIGPADLPQLRALYQALTAGDIQWRDVLAEKRDGEAGEETSKLQKALAAQEAKKQKPAPAAQPSAPESDGARFCRLLTAAQDVATLDRIMDDARATLKGADLHSAEQYAIDRRATLGA